MWLVIPALIVLCAIALALLPAPSEELLLEQAALDRADAPGTPVEGRPHDAASPPAGDERSRIAQPVVHLGLARP